MKQVIEAIERERKSVEAASKTPMGKSAIFFALHIFSVLDRIEAAVKEAENQGDGGEFERVARRELWFSNGRIVGKDQDMGVGTVLSVQQAEFIVDAHAWTISELTAAHTADMRAAEERHKAEVMELINFIESVTYTDDFDISEAKRLIEKHNGKHHL